VISHIFCFLSSVFVISLSLNDSACFDFLSLCGVFFIFRLSAVFIWFRLKDQLWASADPINDNDFGVVNVADPETWVFWRHEYSNISHICRHICTLSFHVINMDVLSLFTDSSFSFLVNLDLYCIDVLYQFEWMNIVYFCQKKKSSQGLCFTIWVFYYMAKRCLFYLCCEFRLFVKISRKKMWCN